jgi:hypothetical protein
LELTIEEEKKRREEETIKITENIEQELNKMYGELEMQRKGREQTSRKIDTMIKEIQQKL